MHNIIHQTKNSDNGDSLSQYESIENINSISVQNDLKAVKCCDQPDLCEYGTDQPRILLLQCDNCGANNGLYYDVPLPMNDYMQRLGRAISQRSTVRQFFMAEEIFKFSPCGCPKFKLRSEFWADYIQNHDLTGCSYVPKNAISCKNCNRTMAYLDPQQDETIESEIKFSMLNLALFSKNTDLLLGEAENVPF